MEPNQIETKISGSAKDFFLNLGVIVALYATVMSFITLTFTVINSAFPQTTDRYYMDPSISMPMSILITFFPIFILLSWILEKGYEIYPEKRKVAIRKWLTYLTLFVAGAVLAGDIVAVIYFFIDGREMTVGFLLKAFVVLLVSIMVFTYFISEVKEKLSSKNRKIWFVASLVLILISISWGFSVLGSPKTQRLYKYDEDKVFALQEINSQVNYYWNQNKVLPRDLSDMSNSFNYFIAPVDPQDGSQYEYIKKDDLTYELCANFNKPSKTLENIKTQPYVSKGTSWNHEARRYCFERVINPEAYQKMLEL